MADCQAIAKVASAAISDAVVTTVTIKTTIVRGTMIIGSAQRNSGFTGGNKVKYAASVAMLVMLLLAGTAVWAQCPTPCQQPAQVQCPQPCAQPCPQQCPQPCPQTCCPASVPAAVGAGPQLAGIECPNFDPAYAASVYNQNATIIAVTEYGMQRATNGNLKDISSEIHGYMTSANDKLAAANAGCGCLTADTARAQAIIAALCSESGECFDVAYAKTLSTLVKQSQGADELAATRAANPQMMQQAKFMAGKESDWAFRLDRWVGDHGYTP